LPSPNRVNGKEPVMVMVEHMVRDEAPVTIDEDDPIEVIANEEPREKEPAEPEGRGHPCVQIGIIPWRRVVSDYRWALIIIIVFDNGRLHILRSRGRLGLRIRA